MKPANWRPWGMLTRAGLVSFQPGEKLPRPCKLRLTDLRHGQWADVIVQGKTTALPPDVIIFTPEGDIMFLGERLEGESVHVALLVQS